MSDQQDLRPPTQVLTRGFDPSLSVGSARPAVFRSSTYVFPSPEAAERAFDLVAGRAQPNVGEKPDLIYSRFNHPNAEILEARVVPLETGAQAALVFNSGMAAIMTALFTFARPGQNIIYTVPIYGGTQHLIEDFLSTLGIGGIPVEAGHTGEMDEAIRSTKNLAIVLIETPANPTIVMTDIRHTTDAVAHLNPKPVVMVDNTLMGPTFQHPLLLGADLSLYSATKYLSGLSDLIAGLAIDDAVLGDAPSDAGVALPRQRPAEAMDDPVGDLPGHHLLALLQSERPAGAKPGRDDRVPQQAAVDRWTVAGAQWSDLHPQPSVPTPLSPIRSLTSRRVRARRFIRSFS